MVSPDNFKGVVWSKQAVEEAAARVPAGHRIQQARRQVGHSASTQCTQCAMSRGRRLFTVASSSGRPSTTCAR